MFVAKTCTIFYNHIHLIASRLLCAPHSALESKDPLLSSVKQTVHAGLCALLFYNPKVYIGILYKNGRRANAWFRSTSAANSTTKCEQISEHTKYRIPSTTTRKAWQYYDWRAPLVYYQANYQKYIEQACT